MSTAALVPETFGLTGDDARAVLRVVGTKTLLRDSFQRLRFSDGFSHARSLAYALSLVLVQGTVAVVGFAAAFGTTRAGDMLARIARQTFPGPASDIVERAVAQAKVAGDANSYGGIAFGLIGALITGSTLLGQIERGMNRVYGVEQDRPPLRKYGLATLLAVVIGSLLAIAFASIALGAQIGSALENSTVNSIWALVRYPLGVSVVTAAIALLFKFCPRRHQPSLSWLVYGAGVSTLLWVGVTMILGLFFRYSSGFGTIYGPLAGMVALLLWALLSSIAILFGAAVAAQLEGERAGRSAPQDRAKVVSSEPDAGATLQSGSPSAATNFRRLVLVTNLESCK